MAVARTAAPLLAFLALALALALAIALALALAAAPAATAQVTPGAYEAVTDRTVARLTVTSPVGRLRARLPFTSATMTLGEGGRIVAGSAVLDAAAVEGPNAPLENRLKGEAGLDTARHPTIRFTGTGGRIAGGAVRLEGNLTIRGVTRPVRFEGEVLRAGPRRLAMLLEARIDRTAFGVTVGRPIYSRYADLRLRLVMVRPRRR